MDENSQKNHISLSLEQRIAFLEFKFSALQHFLEQLLKKFQEIEEHQSLKPKDATWIQSKNPCILYTKVGESVEADIIIKNLEGKNEYRDGENRYWLSKDGKLIFKQIPEYRAKAKNVNPYSF